MKSVFFTSLVILVVIIVGFFGISANNNTNTLPVYSVSQNWSGIGPVNLYSTNPDNQVTKLELYGFDQSYQKTIDFKEGYNIAPIQDGIGYIKVWTKDGRVSDLIAM